MKEINEVLSNIKQQINKYVNKPYMQTFISAKQLDLTKGTDLEKINLLADALKNDFPFDYSYVHALQSLHKYLEENKKTLTDDNTICDDIFSILEKVEITFDETEKLRTSFEKYLQTDPGETFDQFNDISNQIEAVKVHYDDLNKLIYEKCRTSRGQDAFRGFVTFAATVGAIIVGFIFGATVIGPLAYLAYKSIIKNQEISASSFIVGALLGWVLAPIFCAGDAFHFTSEKIMQSQKEKIAQRRFESVLLFKATDKKITSAGYDYDKSYESIKRPACKPKN